MHVCEVNEPIITTDPARWHGEPVICRKRFPVAQVAREFIAGGWTSDEYAREYALTKEQILAALWHAGIYGIWETNRKGRIQRKKVPGWLTDWAYEHAGTMWRESDWTGIPDPEVTT